MEGKQIILFVDDEPAILTKLCDELAEQSYQIMTASSGRQALEIMQEQNIAVIVSDMTMPELSGIELLKIIKDKYPSTVRLMMSGHANTTSLLDMINNNLIYKFITKPWDDTETLKYIVMQGLDYYNQQKERTESLAQVKGDD
ncbi:MAG: response regulator [Sedimentisphaerales bacterium]|nr:response regulator [Sedimentisphaerales bacterium]